MLLLLVSPWHSVRVTVSRPEPDEALSCLAGLSSSAGDLHRWASQLSELMSASTDGAPGLVPLQKRLAMTEQIAQAVQALTRDGNRFRRMEARALYADGLTMAQIAAVFGVSRQRVSAMLRAGKDDGSVAERSDRTRRGDHQVAGEGG
jgi:hypothetical protein